MRRQKDRPNGLLGLAGAGRIVSSAAIGGTTTFTVAYLNRDRSAATAVHGLVGRVDA